MTYRHGRIFDSKLLLPVLDFLLPTTGAMNSFTRANLRRWTRYFIWIDRQFGNDDGTWKLNAEYVDMDKAREDCFYVTYVRHYQSASML